nr:immunoglobulin heavy chain junction region [Macaca mulatta]MOX61972.1 immunoglobulin heavy chain junction region [Macaca mulatta]MOX64678.1 immunoglobulin heavy chain junction region [Macaca mulatta]MOX65290.1 immunoglobulin heavy chain junction region [Macaca mulatta]MOX65363.1 immunoglobulin heavy chain junction region [Macaca mulatta]
CARDYCSGIYCDVNGHYFDLW